MPAEAPLLRLEELRKTFDGVVAVDGVNLSIEAGSIFGLIGPNGAGKTTLFNVVSGLFPATSGHVLLGDKRLTGLAQYQIARLGVARTFQNLQLFAGMTVIENVLAGCHKQGRQGLLASMLSLPAARKEEQALRKRAEEALEFVGLAQMADLQAAQLPPGQQRLVEIARALAGEPRLLLLDEPAAGLTTRETRVLGELVAKLGERHITTVLIEHDMSLVMKVCDTVAVLDQGKLLAIGTPEQVQADSAVVAAYLGEEEPV